MMESQIPPEPGPAEGDSTVPSEISPQVLKSHCQHLADYVKLFLEDLSMGDDQAAPLATEVFIIYD